MKIFKAQKDLKHYLKSVGNNKVLGFVPTMGALHSGHISLIKKSVKECDITVCSIFVNPTQFNQNSDFENYPSTHEADIALLKEAGCSILYLPESVKDVYQNEQPFSIDLSNIESLMEGKYRPGHFDGVVRVVKLLFEIVEPSKAYFGLKDYQQYLVISKMTKQLGLPIEIIGCEIIRESNQLAMSSRNMRLTEQQKEEALCLSKALLFAKNNFQKLSIPDLHKKCWEILEKGSTPEYFEICDAESLLPVDNIEKTKHIRAFTAAVVGDVRLIDNIEIC